MHINRFLFEIACQNILGENILWHEQEQTLYWTDIQAKLLYKCAMSQEVVKLLCSDGFEPEQNKAREDYFQQVMQVFDLPFRMSSFAFTNDKHVLLAAFDNGLALYDYTFEQVDWLTQKEVADEQLRFNDGKCDPKGRYWLGSMVEQDDIKKRRDEHLGALYSFSFVDNVFHSKQLLTGLHISNGLCFSQHATLMYHSDSSTHKVYQYQLSAEGDIESRKLFAKFDKNTYPDGACTDIHGNVWIALWGAACIVCIDPKGHELLRHPLPVTQASCVCIGGPNMNWLFVTSASENLSQEKRAKQPRAGNVFVYEISEALGVSEASVAT